MALLGSHLSEKTKALIGAANMGKKRSEETKAKMSVALKGGKNPFFGKHNTAEHQAKLIALHKGSHHTAETRAKIGTASKTSWQNPVYRARMLEHILIPSEDTKAKQSVAMIGNKNALGHHPTAEAKAKMSATHKGKPMSASQLRNLNLKPNKAELRLQAILDRHFPNTWKFVGDGQLIIGGRLPDFVNINGKKEVVELFGAHWHPIFDVAEKKDHYRQYGFKVAIIWQDELKDEARLVKTFRGKFKE